MAFTIGVRTPNGAQALRADLPEGLETLLDKSSIVCGCLDFEKTFPMPAPRQIKTRTRLAPEERRVQILECAARLIMSDGLELVSMERVAHEAGVRRGLSTLTS